MPRPRRLLAPVIALGAAALPSAAQALTVDAAASLREAFSALAAGPRYSFGGSDQLALQIRRGAPVDVFASASPRYARELAEAGRCSRPQTFATNTLVLIVPRANAAGIRSVGDLARGPRRRLAVGGPGVPVGVYTRTLLGRLGLAGVLTRNVVSSESNVGGVTTKVALGSVDAGFVYRTDARAVAARVRTIALPPRALPTVRYEICVVRRDGADAAQAAAFVRRVLSPTGRVVLRRYGFGLPPLT